LGLIALTKCHSSAELETACKTALSYGEFRLRALRTLIARQPQVVQTALPFLEEHPLIRPLDDYARVVAAAIARKDAAPGANHHSAGEVRFERHGWAGEWSQQRGPDGEDRQGLRGIRPPRSGYSFPGCSPAEPESASPDSSTVTPPRPPLPGESLP
jgi:hypothetical protein